MTTLNKKLLMTSDTFANLPVNDAVSIASVANVDQKKQSSQTVAPTIIIHQSPLPPLPPSTCRKILHLHAAALVAENGSVSDFLEPLQSSHSNNDEHPNPDQDRDQNLSPVPEIVEHPDYITIEHNINSDNEDEDSLDHKEHFILQGGNQQNHHNSENSVDEYTLNQNGSITMTPSHQHSSTSDTSDMLETKFIPDQVSLSMTNGNNTSGTSQAGTNSMISPSDLPDTKFIIEELCPVCGDKVSGYHYGLLTCESCKGFFKRTVQNKKVYTCVAERSCHIDKTQRKRCPFCRFQKCLEVGMKLEAVRADRMRGGRNKFGPMYKRDRARKLQMLRQRQLALQSLYGGSDVPVEFKFKFNYSGSESDSLTSISSSSTHQSPSSHFANIQIKQEIQIPQISSLTSPDSSPGPLSLSSNGNGNHVHHHQSSSIQNFPNNSISNHHRSNVYTIHNSSSSSANTNSSNTAASSVNHQHRIWHNSTSTSGSTPISGSSSTSASTKPFNNLIDNTLLSNSLANPSPSSMTTTMSSSNTNPNTSVITATAISQSSNCDDGPVNKVIPLIRDFVSMVDDREWLNSLYTLLQNQTYNQCEVDLFELMCKVLDQNLFSQVDWARNSVFFKDLKVDDQMKLLQYSWSDMLVLDHLHQRMHNGLPDETILHNGQKFDLLSLGLLGVLSSIDHFNDLSMKLHELKFDVSEYVCIKFMILLNPDVRGISNRKFVQEGYERVQQALLEYTITIYPQIGDKFGKLLSVLPEIHAVATRGEEYLYHKHCTGGAPTQTLLMEMLHAKRK